MNRTFARVLEALLIVCMLISAPVLIIGAVGVTFWRLVRRTTRKAKHRMLGCKRVRRRARTNLFPEPTV